MSSENLIKSTEDKMRESIRDYVMSICDSEYRTDVIEYMLIDLPFSGVIAQTYIMSEKWDEMEMGNFAKAYHKAVQTS